MTLCHRPAEYYAAQDCTADTNLKASQAILNYRNGLYFTLAITADSLDQGSYLLYKDGLQNYSNNVTRNTFHRDQDIFLLNGSDTIKLSDYQYERNWGYGNEDVFVLMFDRPKNEKQLRHYDLYIRNFSSEIGTATFPLAKLLAKYGRLKGC